MHNLFISKIYYENGSVQEILAQYITLHLLLSSIVYYPKTSAILGGESGVKNYLDLPRSQTEVSVKVGHVRASPAAFDNPRRAIVSRDAHIWRSSSERKHHAP